MESSLRHILHFSNPEVEPAVTPESRGEALAENSNDPVINNHNRSLSNGTNSRKRAAPASRISYPRKRAIRACQKCRIRRTKCDNQVPACSACLDLGAECIYSESDPSTFDTASLTILEKLNTIEELLRRTPQTSQPETPVRNDHVIQTPGSVPSTFSAAAPEKATPSNARRMSIEAVLTWPCFSDYAPRPDLKTLLASSLSSVPHSRSARSEFLIEEDLLQRFLDHVFIFNPILEESDVHKYAYEVRRMGFDWDAKSCLLLLIHANGCLTYSDHFQGQTDSIAFRTSAEFRKAESYFTAAQERMGLLLCCSGLLEAQCFFLAGVYLMATLRPLEAWKMFVQALTSCQTFSLDNTTPVEERERVNRLQQSVYWTCFKSELELRLELNVVDNSVWDLTYPAFYPSPPEGLKTQKELVWYYYLAEIALRRLGNRILYTFHKQSLPNADFEAVATFEQQATDWIRSLPPVLSLEHPPRRDGDLADSLKFILEGHLLDCYEMMYWPFLTELIFNGPNYANSNTFDALAYKSLQRCVERIQKNEHGFYGRHHGTWLMLRSCTRSALVLLAARKDPKLSSLLPAEWRQAVWKVVDMLRFWRYESRDVEDKLRILESSLNDTGLDRHSSF